MRISDWSSDVCSSDLHIALLHPGDRPQLEEHDEHGDCGGGPELRNQIRERMAQSTARRHDARGDASLQRGSAARYGAVVGSRLREEIGRASGRARVWKSVSISVVAVSFKKKSKKNQHQL